MVSTAGFGTALLLARVLFAALFISSARDKFGRDPQEIAMIRSLRLPAPERLEWATGVFEVIGAAALVVGAGARVAAAMLALFVVFTTLTFVRFWTVQGPPEAARQMRNVFFGNGALVAGLIYLMLCGPGPWALLPAW